MTVNLIRSDSLYTGVPYAYASIAAPGALIFTAGAVLGYTDQLVEIEAVAVAPS
jgi:hypothetical protein